MTNIGYQSTMESLKRKGFGLRRLSVLVLTLATFQHSVLAGKTILYVAPDGNDQSSGRLEEPLASLEGAPVNVRRLKAANPKDAVEVQIRGVSSRSMTVTNCLNGQHPVSCFIGIPTEKTTTICRERKSITRSIMRV